MAQNKKQIKQKIMRNYEDVRVKQDKLIHKEKKLLMEIDWSKNDLIEWKKEVEKTNHELENNLSSVDIILKGAKGKQNEGRQKEQQ